MRSPRTRRLPRAGLSRECEMDAPRSWASTPPRCWRRSESTAFGWQSSGAQESSSVALAAGFIPAATLFSETAREQVLQPVLVEDRHILAHDLGAGLRRLRRALRHPLADPRMDDCVQLSPRVRVLEHDASEPYAIDPPLANYLLAELPHH